MKTFINHKGRDHEVLPVPVPGKPGKFNVVVAGETIMSPPHNGIPERPLELDTEQGTIDAGRDHIKAPVDLKP